MWSAIATHIPSRFVWFQAALTLLIPVAVHFVYKSLYRFVDGRAVPPNAEKSKNAPLPAAHSESRDGRLFTGNFDEDLAFVKDTIGANSDVRFRAMTIPGLGARAALFYVDGMQEDKQINMLLTNLFMSEAQSGDGAERKASLADWENKLPASRIREIRSAREFNRSILSGHAALLIEGCEKGLILGSPGGPSRSIEEPVSESILRGSRLGFTETLSQNTALLRRQGTSEGLQMRTYRIGNEMQREVIVAYFERIANPDLLKEVQARIEKIDIDFAAESGYIEQLIEDNYLSPFLQAQNTERPDRVIAALLEGKIAILLDGTPFVLIVPATFSSLLQSPEDYYERWLPGSLLRMLRFFAAFIALMAPSLYIAFISFHPGLIPTELALTIIETRQGVPFPSLIEVLILEVSIEILREAGLRLPKPIGPAMGIVGGLVIGEAAVNAGIVSPFLVIVVAVTAISSFSIPVYSAGITLRMLRFVGMLFAAILGMFGAILFFLLICSHLAKLKSFGVPYLTPFSPFRLNDWKDLFVRAPYSLMNRRPAMMKTKRPDRK